MSITCLFALNRPEIVQTRWIFVMKIHLMLLVSLMLVVTEQHLKTLVVVVTLSIAFFSIKGGVFTLVTGGGYRVSGPPAGMLAGNNEAAVGFLMVLPYLYRITSYNVCYTKLLRALRQKTWCTGAQRIIRSLPLR